MLLLRLSQLSTEETRRFCEGREFAESLLTLKREIDQAPKKRGRDRIERPFSWTKKKADKSYMMGKSLRKATMDFFREHVVVVIGSWSSPTWKSGSVSAPRARRWLKTFRCRGVKSYVMCEYRTSKVCHSCVSQLTPEDGEFKKHEVAFYTENKD
jgi:hypothetical protein